MSLRSQSRAAGHALVRTLSPRPNATWRYIHHPMASGQLINARMARRRTLGRQMPASGWRSGPSFRGASSFSAEQLVSKHHTSALGHKLSLPLSRPDLLSQLSRSSLARAWWRASAETATRRFHVPDSSRARKGRRKAQAWMERNNSNKPPTFLGDNDVRRKASPTIIHIALRLHLSEHATTQQWPP